MSSFYGLFSTQQLTSGDVVLVGTHIGVVRFMGTIYDINGIKSKEKHVGIELIEAYGECDGTLYGYRYFDAPIGYGMFVPISKILRVITAWDLLNKLKDQHKVLLQFVKDLDHTKSKLVATEKQLAQCRQKVKQHENTIMCMGSGLNSKDQYISLDTSYIPDHYQQHFQSNVPPLPLNLKVNSNNDTVSPSFLSNINTNTNTNTNTNPTTTNAIKQHIVPAAIKIPTVQIEHFPNNQQLSTSVNQALTPISMQSSIVSSPMSLSVPMGQSNDYVISPMCATSATPPHDREYQHTQQTLPFEHSQSPISTVSQLTPITVSSAFSAIKSKIETKSTAKTTQPIIHRTKAQKQRRNYYDMPVTNLSVQIDPGIDRICDDNYINHKYCDSSTEFSWPVISYEQQLQELVSHCGSLNHIKKNTH